MNNAGLNTEALFAEVSRAKTGYGVNVMTPEKGVVDLKAAGVVDPARVLREEIQNSVSIAATAMTMGALVADIPEPKTAPTPDMGGMGMM
jgi:chaperonin GroEL